MEEPSCDVYSNQVPYRATRTLSDTPESLDRRFEPTWARKCYSTGFTPNISSNTIASSTYIYTRDNIANVIYSIPTDTPPSQCLLSYDHIFSDDTAASIKILDKSYYTTDNNDDALLRTNQKAFEVRGLSGRGRGRGVDYIGSWAGAVSSESDGKCFSSRGPIWRSTFANESSSSNPRRRVLSECSCSETISEAMSESPRDAGADWQYFQDDETFEQEYYPTREQQLVQKEIGEVFNQNQELDRKELSWHDTSSFIKTRRRLEVDTNQVPITTSSHKHDIPQFSKRLQPNSFSFLNPSDVDTTSITSNTNQSNSISTFSDEDLKHSQKSFNELNFPQKLKPQDPKHLWYYIDPKESIQGPFLSEQMDDWYGRNFFPPTLPIWRECDSKPFQLTNLLNITEMSNEPFSVGAGRLLVSREYHPIKGMETRDLSTNMSESIIEDNKVIYHDKLMDSKMEPETVLLSNTPSLDELTLFGHNSAKEAEMVQLRDDEFSNNPKDDTSDAHLVISDLSSTTGEVTLVTYGQKILIESTFDSETNPIFIQSEKVMPQLETKNMWLGGPPRISERKNKIKDTSLPDTTTSIHPFTIERPVTSGLTAPAQPPQNTQETKFVKNKNNEKSTTPRSPNDPLIEDSSSWKKVGLVNKKKTKTKKASQFESNNFDLQSDEVAVQSDSNRSSKSYTQRPKLDELDSFGINRQSVPLSTPTNVPQPQNEAPVVNFNLILTEQTKEEEHSVDTKKKAMLLTQKQEDLTQHTKKKTWNSSPIDTTTLSFLAIESEQKKTIIENISSREKIQIDEAQTTHQPVNASTWARVTKSEAKGSGKVTTDTKTSASLKVDESAKSSKIENISIPEQTAESQVARIVPDGILLSPVCYEWSSKEILFLNNHVDPPTVISFLQEFNGVFEMTQLASEMLGTSKRTNALCKRICEDLTRLKKLRQKSASVDEDWVMVSKKPAKTAKKRGKPSKSSQN